MMNKKRGFTMAEALSVLILLGVVAVITIPTTVSRMTANQNRTKIKKALATYDSAVRLMISENRITSVDRLNRLMSQNNCSRVYNYFKAVEQDGCIFKTADGVWWDVGSARNGASMAKALIATDKDLLTIDAASKENLNPKNAFYLITDFDERKVPHIADMAYVNQKGLRTQIMNTSKLYAFMDNKKIYDYYNFCSDNNFLSCVYKNSDGSISFYDNNGDMVAVRRDCNEDGTNCASNNMVHHNNCKYDDNNMTNCIGTGGTCPIQDDKCNPYVNKYYMHDGVNDFNLSSELKEKFKNATPVEGATFRTIGISYKDCKFGAESVEDCTTTENGKVTYFVQYTHPKGGTIEVYYQDTVPQQGMDAAVKNKKTEAMTYYKPNPIQGGPSITCKYTNCDDLNISTCSTPPTNPDCY